jgi:hypothetical protein
MELNVAKQMAALDKMTVGQLRLKYAEVFNEATSANNKAWLIKRIIWRLQSLADGDLSDRARQRAAEIANDADLRRKAPVVKAVRTDTPVKVVPFAPAGDPKRLPPPGSIITRVYKGVTLRVTVLESGFEFEGEVYKSLSAVAKKITGSHCNGFLFFRLTRGEA